MVEARLLRSADGVKLLWASQAEAFGMAFWLDRLTRDRGGPAPA
jgi:hypothetical protein